MNKKRTNFDLTVNHIRVTPYWLLGLIEGDGNFLLQKSKLTPTFSLTLSHFSNFSFLRTFSLRYYYCSLPPR